MSIGPGRGATDQRTTTVSTGHHFCFQMARCEGRTGVRLFGYTSGSREPAPEPDGLRPADPEVHLRGDLHPARAVAAADRPTASPGVSVVPRFCAKTSSGDNRDLGRRPGLCIPPSSTERTRAQACSDAAFAPPTPAGRSRQATRLPCVPDSRTYGQSTGGRWSCLAGSRCRPTRMPPDGPAEVYRSRRRHQCSRSLGRCHMQSRASTAPTLVSSMGAARPC
jgi:hypothetical protein